MSNCIDSLRSVSRQEGLYINARSYKDTFIVEVAILKILVIEYNVVGLFEHRCFVEIMLGF